VTALDIDAAVDHLVTARRRLDRTAWAIAGLHWLANRDGPTDVMIQRLRLMLKKIEEDHHCG
jgi:hypothetical protein